jgi:acyl-CoA synthetase (AMP-forming)/AMP-acid ligase II
VTSGQRTQPPTLVAWLATVVGGRPAHPALIAGSRLVSYSELWERSGEIARWLLNHSGFEPGSTVGLIGTNHPDYIAAYFGVLRAGGTVAPLNERLTHAEIGGQLELVRAVGVLTADLPIAPFGSDIPIWPIEACHTDRAAKLPALSAKSPACILLTSGSTGRPKGVVHSHSTLLHAASQLATVMPFGPEERSLLFLPFYASIPEAVLPVLLTGGAVEMIDKFDPDEIAHACRAGATSFDIVPTLMARLLDHGELDALRSVRWIWFASEPMPVALLERWWDALPEVATHQLYGMTECLPITHASPYHLRAYPDSVGLPFPTSAVSVIDAHGAEVEPGVAGEITCRTPARMVKYLGDAEATLAATTPAGAMRTGDLGHLNDDGSVTLTGRLKDLIISGGMNVAPAEIEAVACRHPAVASAIVVGVPDTRWGETPVVIAIPQNGHALEPHDLLTFCSSALAGFKRPSAAAVVDTLPLTGIGKSAKGLVRQQILDGEIALVRRS